MTEEGWAEDSIDFGAGMGDGGFDLEGGPDNQTSSKYYWILSESLTLCYSSSRAANELLFL